VAFHESIWLVNSQRSDLMGLLDANNHKLIDTSIG
jgi:hypothetical protein